MGTRSGWCQPKEGWKTDLLLGGKGRPGITSSLSYFAGRKTGSKMKGKDEGNKRF